MTDGKMLGLLECYAILETKHLYLMLSVKGLDVAVNKCG